MRGTSRASSCASVAFGPSASTLGIGLPGRLQDRVGQLLRRERLECRHEVAVRRHVLERVGHLARPLVGLAQGDLADQPLHVVLVRDELVGEQVEQFRVRLAGCRPWSRSTGLTMPRPIIIAQRRLTALRAKALLSGDVMRGRQLLAAAVGRHRPNVRGRGDLVLLPLLRLRLGDRLAVRASSGAVVCCFLFLSKTLMKLTSPSAFSAMTAVGAWAFGKRIRAVQERLDAVVVRPACSRR